MSEVTIAQAFNALKQAISDDPEYAWAWHCNLAMPIYDEAGCDIGKANQSAALIMAQMFDHDITAHPHFSYEKSNAQAFFEMRRDADRGDAA